MVENAEGGLFCAHFPSSVQTPEHTAHLPDTQEWKANRRSLQRGGKSWHNPRRCLVRPPDDERDDMCFRNFARSQQ
jgi:hypothetical protein